MISSRKQNIKGECEKWTANKMQMRGEGRGELSNEYYRNLREEQVNFILTKPKSFAFLSLPSVRRKVMTSPSENVFVFF